jgi:hypothetical protein
LIESLLNISNKTAHLDETISLLKEQLYDAYKVDMESRVSGEQQDKSFTDVHNSVDQYRLEELDVDNSYPDIVHQTEDTAYIDTNKPLPNLIKLGKLSSNLISINSNKADIQGVILDSNEEPVSSFDLARNDGLLFTEPQLNYDNDPLRMTSDFGKDPPTEGEVASFPQSNDESRMQGMNRTPSGS